MNCSILVRDLTHVDIALKCSIGKKIQRLMKEFTLEKDEGAYQENSQIPRIKVFGRIDLYVMSILKIVAV